jgi:hypothetical protein
MTIGLAIVLLATATAQQLPSLTPEQQTILTHTRSQAATRLAPSAVAKLKTISNSLATGPALDDYAGGTRRAVIAAFPDVKLNQGDVDSLSAIAMADAIDFLKQQNASLMEVQIHMAHERLGTLMTSLANILKKIHETHEGIIKNIK